VSKIAAKQYRKETEFRLWPTEPRENEKEAWERCVVAIDEGISAYSAWTLVV